MGEVLLRGSSSCWTWKECHQSLKPQLARTSFPDFPDPLHDEGEFDTGLPQMVPVLWEWHSCLSCSQLFAWAEAHSSEEPCLLGREERWELGPLATVGLGLLSMACGTVHNSPDSLFPASPLLLYHELLRLL